MKIITAKYTYIDNTYKKELGILYNKKIIKVAPISQLKKEYSDLEIVHYKGNSIIYPGFINLHTHLEFSSNSAKLEYGNFIKWLYSVFAYREELINSLDTKTINSALKQMAQSGVTTIGTISSFGIDMQECANAKQRVIYFNEVIGSNPATVDALFGDFKHRLHESIKLSSDSFYPAVAVHSPYSVHPHLIKAVLDLAKSKNLLTTAHFLESPQEREWLQSNSGEFKELFEKYFKTTSAVNTINSFLDLFKNHPTLFTHCTQATKEEIKHLNQQKHSIIHCPRSNRLLGCGRAQIEYVNNLLLGTDGLSSNYTLSILDEMKSALMLHHKANLTKLANHLIQAATSNAAKAINIPIGEIKENNYADFAIFTLPEDLTVQNENNLALHTIINCNTTTATIVGGEVI